MGQLCLIVKTLLFQLIDITGKDQDESMIALHDCNGDVNRAINVLLEGSPDTVSIGFVWRLVLWAPDFCEISATLDVTITSGKTVVGDSSTTKIIVTRFNEHAAFEMVALKMGTTNGQMPCSKWLWCMSRAIRWRQSISFQLNAVVYSDTALNR